MENLLIKILVIPDTQVKADVPLDHFKWIAKCIREYKPSHIVHLGDHWDMPSLSSYSSRKELQNKTVLQDIRAGDEAMQVFWKSLKGMRYQPEFHLLHGNHEDRIRRYCEDNVVLDEFLSLDTLNTEGWTVHPFKEVFCIGGVHFTHYYYNAYTGRAYGGSAESILKNIGISGVMGHRQGKFVAARSTPTGDVHRMLIVGSGYLHQEVYLGPQAKESWRGVVMLNDVENGDYDMMELSYRYLCRKYEKVELNKFLKEKYGYGI